MTQLQFNTALLELKDRLTYYALSLTSDQDRAQNLLQETFLKALIYKDKFTPETNFKAWIYIIMKNTFINEYRKGVKTRNTLDVSNYDVYLRFQKDNSYSSPENIYNTKEILKCINALEDEFKVPFNMFLDGYKYKEIADHLDLPIGTVKSRIFFARKKLATALNEYGYSQN